MHRVQITCSILIGLVHAYSYIRNFKTEQACIEFIQPYMIHYTLKSFKWSVVIRACQFRKFQLRAMSVLFVTCMRRMYMTFCAI
jgi:hypothetical protein